MYKPFQPKSFLIRNLISRPLGDHYDSWFQNQNHPPTTETILGGKNIMIYLFTTGFECMKAQGL